MAKIEQKSETAKEKARERRAILCQLTAQARQMRDMMASTSGSLQMAEFYSTRPLNYFITNYIYQNSEKSLVFKTFNEWKSEGATIIKGSKAYVIWGQPQRRKKNETEQQKQANEENPESEFFPLCYLFSNEQVHFNKPEEQQQEPPTESEPQDTIVVDIDSCL